MAENYTKRFDASIACPTTSSEMATRFQTVMNQVASMISTYGPTYHVWIRFQLGIPNSDDDTPVIFCTDSTDKEENCITKLDITKSCAQSCNEFTLSVSVDPFNNGQNTTSKLEALDEMLALAMSYQFEDTTTEDTAENILWGFIQYGYAITTCDDANLTSPYYKFLLTGASMDVNASSGLATYSFTGTCALATDCDYTATIDGYGADSTTTIMEIAIRTLYKYYGNADNIPTVLADDSSLDNVENDYNYLIDVSETTYNDSPTVAEATEWVYGSSCAIESVTDTNPLSYVKDLLDKFPCTKTEMDSMTYEQFSALSYSNKPRFDWWTTSTEGESDSTETIHISHYYPASAENTQSTTDTSSMPIIKYKEGALTWGTQKTTIFLRWKPEVDLMLYLIRRAMKIRGLIGSENSDLVEEYYDATLEMVGIPADLAVGTQMQIIPRMYQTVSRTQGWYYVQAVTDSISTKGSYTTTINLYKMGNTTDSGNTSTTTTEEETSETVSDTKTDAEYLTKGVTHEESSYKTYNELFPWNQ